VNKRIFIGCSSSSKLDNKYYRECDKLLKGIFKLDLDLVFGASHDGVMGMAYDIALDNNREVIGVCPEVYKDDFKKLKCNKEIVTKTVNERTNGLISNSDILLFLPGGIGTMYELFCSIESKRSHEHNKEIIVFNMDNFFNDLFKQIDKVYNENFTGRQIADNYKIFNNRDDIIEYIIKIVKERK